MTHESKPRGRVQEAMSPRVLVALVVAALVALVTTGVQALDEGKPMPEIGLADLHGQRVDRAALRGKVVIVDFWASWCAPCKEEMPVLERLYAKHAKDGLVVVGVSVDRDVANVRSFLSKLSVSFPIVHDLAHAVADRFEPPKMPTSYVIDRQGVVRYVHGGFRAEDAKRLASEVESLLRSGAPPSKR